MNVNRNDSRINVRQIGLIFAATLVIPLAVGVFVDIVFGTVPMATLVLGFIAIPLSSLFVLRSTLSEFDRVIQEVAPLEDHDNTDDNVLDWDDGDKSWSGTGLFDDDPDDTGLYMVAEKNKLASASHAPASDGQNQVSSVDQVSPGDVSLGDDGGSKQK